MVCSNGINREHCTFLNLQCWDRLIRFLEQRYKLHRIQRGWGKLLNYPVDNKSLRRKRYRISGDGIFLIIIRFEIKFHFWFKYRLTLQWLLSWVLFRWESLHVYVSDDSSIDNYLLNIIPKFKVHDYSMLSCNLQTKSRKDDQKVISNSETMYNPSLTMIQFSTFKLQFHTFGIRHRSTNNGDKHSLSHRKDCISKSFKSSQHLNTN